MPIFLSSVTKAEFCTPKYVESKNECNISSKIPPLGENLCFSVIKINLRLNPLAGQYLLYSKNSADKCRARFTI
jgi:hypothetical protein